MRDRIGAVPGHVRLAPVPAIGAQRRHDEPRVRPRAPLRTVVADPNAVSREMLRGQLSEDPRFAFAGAATHAAELISLVNREQPDVAVIDSALPPGGALATVAAVLGRRPQIAIVVLADVGDHAAAPDAALAALRAGARGYLDRGLRPAALASAVAAVADGEPALSRKLTMQLLARLIGLPEDVGGLRPVRSPLSDREWEVLDLLDGGLSTAQIADQLVVSSETVRSHVKRILRKLGVHNRAEAIVAARQLRGRA
jgi:NarL family two-component system response regulator LiaR